KPKGFFYLDHRTVDAKYAIITDSFITPGNVHDSVPYLARLDRQIETFGFDVEAVGLDAGYNNAPLCHGLVERGLAHSVIGYCRPSKRKGMLAKREYRYDAQQDCYHCPQNEILRYQTTNGEGYRLYASDPDKCRECPLRAQCTRSEKGLKQLSRHVWQKDRERIAENRLSEVGKQIYKGRQETVER
ncbi:transposase, partial [Aeromonas australiensis]